MRKKTREFERSGTIAWDWACNVSILFRKIERCTVLASWIISNQLLRYLYIGFLLEYLLCLNVVFSADYARFATLCCKDCTSVKLGGEILGSKRLWFKHAARFFIDRENVSSNYAACSVQRRIVSLQSIWLGNNNEMQYMKRKTHQDVEISFICVYVEKTTEYTRIGWLGKVSGMYSEGHFRV